MPSPAHGEYWLVCIAERQPEPAQVDRRTEKVYPCGDEQGWPIDITRFIRKIRLS